MFMACIYVSCLPAHIVICLCLCAFWRLCISPSLCAPCVNAWATRTTCTATHSKPSDKFEPAATRTSETTPPPIPAVPRPPSRQMKPDAPAHHNKIPQPSLPPAWTSPDAATSNSHTGSPISTAHPPSPPPRRCRWCKPKTPHFCRNIKLSP